MHITEWMYQGLDGEFIEFSNTGNISIDMTGWSYDDDSGVPGTIDLSAFGIVAPGESVLLIESEDPEAFRSAWLLGPSVKIIGNNAANLGRNDTINLYDPTSALVDKLAYGDQNIPGSIRTQNISGITFPEFWGNGLVNPEAVLNWQLSNVSDGYSRTSVNGDVGNPGVLAIPEPTAWACIGIASAGLVIWRRRRRS